MTMKQPIAQIGRWRRLAAGGLLCVGFLARAASAAEGEIGQIAEVLSLASGQSVADVGAGDGEWSVELSRIVGDDGRVFATEIGPDRVRRLGELFARRGLRNAAAVLADERSSGLAGGSCDAILLRLVYHHLTEPVTVAADLYRALRPAGRVAVIDMLPQQHLHKLPGVPERGGHGVLPDALIEEMRRAGFEVLARHDAWGGNAQRFCVVFERQASRAGREVGGL
jgi:SAM-dependent methyltransferase